MTKLSFLFLTIIAVLGVLLVAGFTLLREEQPTSIDTSDLKISGDENQVSHSELSGPQPRVSEPLTQPETEEETPDVGGIASLANSVPRITDEAEKRAEPHNISKVLVETNKQEYKQDEKLVVTIRNNLDTSITTFDQQAFCSIIRLEQERGTEWKEVRNCFSAVPRQLVILKPHTETIVKLKVLDLSPGIYRATIIFSMGESFNFGKSFVASSSPFRVD